MGGESSTDFNVEDLIADEEMVVTITNDGFIRRISVDAFKKQRRGGKGVSGISSKKEDFIKMMNIASTHDIVFLFSNKGKIFGIKTYELPLASKTSRGKSLKGIINLAAGENITAMCSVPEIGENIYLCMCTRDGILKKTEVGDFVNARKGGIIAINLKKNDELVDVDLVMGDDDVVIATKMGLILRTNLKKMRSMGRNAAGIIGMRLSGGDSIIGVDVVKKDSSLLVVTSKGFGKLVPYKNFATKGRGGKGMHYVKVTDKVGTAVEVRSVFPEDEVIIASMSGMTIRLTAKDVSVQGRASSGVRLLVTDDTDEVSDVAIIREEKR